MTEIEEFREWKQKMGATDPDGWAQAAWMACSDRHRKEIFKLTMEDIENLITDRGGFSGHILRGLGIHPCKPPKGWKQRLVGTEMSREKYLDLLDKRNLLRKGRISEI